MANRIEHALEKLKTNGVRMTPQRQAILSYLLDCTSHPTADDIYKALEKHFPHMSVATVYNNLRMFIDAGLVRELPYGDNSSRFDADMSDHYHAICGKCGTIADFDFPQLTDAETAAANQTSFLVKGHRLEVYGVCPHCAREHAH